MRRRSKPSVSEHTGRDHPPIRRVCSHGSQLLACVDRGALAAGGQNQRGANLVEYILLIAFIAIIVIIAVKVLGRTISTKFSSANSNLQ